MGEAGVKANNKDHTKQFQMEYYGSGAGKAEVSQLIVEWAHQHGCGDNPKSQCNNVIQYMCMNQGNKNDYPAGAKKTQGDRKKRGHYMRDGINTGTQKYVKGPNRHERTGKEFIDRIRKAHDALDADKGLHESLTWYDMCRYREANNGLFTADQNLAQERFSRFDKKRYSSARITRQNPGGTQRGLECPEERDYYPYWEPTLQGKYDAEYQRTPWIDAAYLGDKSNCPNVLNNSFNNRRKFRCVLPGARSYGKSIHKAGCLKEGGKWVAFESFLEVLENVNTAAACDKIAAKNEVNNVVWRPLRSDSTEAKCIVKAPQPFCGPAATTRVNHLGNALTDPLYASRYNLRLPHFPSGDTKRCVLRIRYNITTGDYDPQNTFADSNGKKSPVKNDPTKNILGGDTLGLTLAINTAQFGRTFQDRSHIFKIVPRTAAMDGKFLHNLNVRGQRGNIVQNYPSVEYDFIPDQLKAKKGDLVHIQWAGYNTNPANRAGEGTDATDRNNFVQMAGDLDTSYPEQIEKSTFWQNVESLTAPGATSKDIAVALASSGYYCGYKAHSTCPASQSLTGNTREELQGQLNNANASYRGHVLQVKEVGTYFYMCTRNNNFSNRSQKGSIVVQE